ncbi:piggyBac transposable element-derived protein 3-like [Schistocerca americana]|uniref:piggyBac transposable element-derived protein 3-like n=1 Tax=Schistocerca americana TaxID=7009 RepID=UPI001F502A7F|nr:piggyBac transposable element-derived protein 3-like [Schistocerca americana]
MIRNHKSLSEEEILLLLEGDLSDLELDTSDVEEEIENAWQRDPTTLDIQFLQGMDLDMVEILDPQSNDEDDVPLASRLLAETNLAPSHSAQEIQCDTHWDLRWRMKDIEEVDTSCNAVFSDPPGDELTPLQYFRTMCSDDIIQSLVEQYNLYCTQKTCASLDTNVREIEKYIGINILAGVVKTPSYRMYWAEATRFSPLADSMPRNRFDKLRNYLHVNDNTKMKPREDPDYDKLFKVRLFVDEIKQGFSIIEPEEYHSVDELIIPFKGHSPLKQYVKSKRHKWGIKVFARADNWFTSYNLISAVKNYGILAVGTVRPTRLQGCSLKADSELKKQGRGSYDYRTETERNIIALKWYDNKSVVLASSYKGVSPVEPVKRWSVGERKHIDVPRPDIVREYNRSMGGVDLHDMLVALYRSNIDVKRFNLRIVFHLLDMCLVNAWLLYRRHCRQRGIIKHMSLLIFRSDVAHGLLKAEDILIRRRGRPSDDSPSPTVVKKRAPLVPSPVDDHILERNASNVIPKTGTVS